MTLYSLQGIVQRYRHRVVLDIERLDIEGGRIHALLGPNGAGKTTLLNLLAFLEMPASGRMDFCGQPVSTSPGDLLALRRRVVLVDQHPIMFTSTVAANIEFGLKIRKMTGGGRQRRVDEALETVGLSRYRQAAAHELSGGETQRLALARGLALEPEVLLCDEPTASVDSENQAIIVALLRERNRTRGTTIIFTTHDRLQAASIADNTLVLEGGRPAGTAYENTFAWTLRSREEGTLHCTLQGAVELRLPLPSGIISRDKGGRIHIDPERITLSRWEEQRQGDPPLACTVVLVMAEGERIRAVVTIGVLLTILMHRADYQRLRPAVGERLALHLGPEAVTLLAPATS